MGRRTQPDLTRINREIQVNRELFLRRLAATSAQDLKRLQDAYKNLLFTLQPLGYDLVDALQAGAQIDINQLSEYNQFIRQLKRELTVIQGLITPTAQTLQDSGARLGYDLGLIALKAGGVGARFSTPVLEQIRATINYVDSPAFRDAVSNYAEYHTAQIADAILAANATGRNPRLTAQIIDGLSNGKYPLQDALRLTRTTQIYAARTATNETYIKNGVDVWIWSANIGNPRTCLGCILKHGTLNRGVLNDHHNGRCAAIPVTPTWASLGLVTGKDVNIETGEQWLLKQSQADQTRIMGRTAWEAWQTGLVNLNEFVGTYQNPIFGTMTHRRSLTEILGY